MIEYVEVRDESREVVGIIDTAQSIIWHSVYFGVGDFELYTEATEKAVSLLRVGRFVTRPDDIEVGIIERLEYAADEQSGRMIVAAGRFAKSILDRRLIYRLSGSVNRATILSGNVEAAVRETVKNNAISCPFDSRRNISLLKLGSFANTKKTIVDASGNAARKQVSYGNLLTYTDEVLEEYGLGSLLTLDPQDKALQYIVYEGTDRSVGNAAGLPPVIFSQEFDNLGESAYSYDSTTEKNVALIGGEGEGVARFYSLIGGTQSGIQRREIWVDAASISRKYKDDSDEEQNYTDAEYKGMLDAHGEQEIAPLVPSEIFNGTIDVTGGNWLLNRDFFLGDIVTVEENNLGIYINVRIRETLESQDESGYKISAVYQ